MLILALLSYVHDGAYAELVATELSQYAKNPKIISVFGSSVANGAFCSGNCSGKPPSSTTGGCYQSRLKQFQQKEGRSVFNNCHGGDTTTKLLNRFDQMLSTDAGFVFIGLSLANEGIRVARFFFSALLISLCSKGTDPEAIYTHFKNGMLQLINQSRAAGVVPLMGLCYPNSDFTPKQVHYLLCSLVNSALRTRKFSHQF
jgi:hypothetical protein